MFPDRCTLVRAQVRWYNMRKDTLLGEGSYNLQGEINVNEH